MSLDIEEVDAVDHRVAPISRRFLAGVRRVGAEELVHVEHKILCFPVAVESLEMGGHSVLHFEVVHRPPAVAVEVETALGAAGY